MMTTTDSILAGFFGVLTLLGVLLLFPRFRKHARWQPGYVPMSLRSRGGGAVCFALFAKTFALFAVRRKSPGKTAKVAKQDAKFRKEIRFSFQTASLAVAFMRKTCFNSTSRRGG